MLRIKTKPYTEKQLKYFSDLNYNNIYGTLLEEEHILNSIDADLPTTEEYFYRKLKYRAMMKPWKYLDAWRNLMRLKYLKGGIDVSKL